MQSAECGTRRLSGGSDTYCQPLDTASDSQARVRRGKAGRTRSCRSLAGVPNIAFKAGCEDITPAMSAKKRD